MSTVDLYTPSDIKKVREILYEEQNKVDALTGLPLDKSKAVLDHRHDDNQFVRGVLHRNVNSALGRIENCFLRDISWWCQLTLPEFLRNVANYLERPEDTRYRHSDAFKRVKVQFNKLNSKQQDSVLESLGSTKGTNLKDRKAKFAKVVLDRSLGYDKIVAVINDVKEK